MRAKNFIGRAFDCWRIQLEESKLIRIAKFPELWRMSHIADNENSDSDPSDEGSDAGGDDEGEGGDGVKLGGVNKKQKHRHSGELGSSVARWGAFETVTGSAENPQKKVFFKPLIPFFHSTDIGAGNGLGSGSVTVSDMFRTGGALRAGMSDHGHETRNKTGGNSGLLTADFSPAIGLPPQVRYRQTRDELADTAPISELQRNILELPSYAAVDAPADTVVTASETRGRLTELVMPGKIESEFIPSHTPTVSDVVSPEVGFAATLTEHKFLPTVTPAFSVIPPSNVVVASETNRNCVIDLTAPAPLSVISRAHNLENSGTFSALSTGGTEHRGDSSDVASRFLSRGMSAPFEEVAGGGRAARRSSLTMATASSAIKAASGIAKRRASVSTGPLGGVSTSSTVSAVTQHSFRSGVSNRVQQSGNNDSTFKSGDTRATKSSSQQKVNGQKYLNSRNIYEPSDDDERDWGDGAHQTVLSSSDGDSDTPMLVHKVLNSPSYEKWAQRVAQVD